MRAALDKAREAPASTKARILAAAEDVFAISGFAGWTRALSGHRLQDVEWQLFMLAVHNVMLLFLLDSRHFASRLGGSVHQPDVRRRVRAHVINLVHTLLARDARPE